MCCQHELLNDITYKLCNTSSYLRAIPQTPVGKQISALQIITSYNQVVDRILEGPLPGETRPRDKAFYAKMEEMRNKETIMEQLQVDAISYILDTPIFTCVQFKLRNGEERVAWQRIPHEDSPFPVGNQRGIYLYNADIHFKLVLKP